MPRNDNIPDFTATDNHLSIVAQMRAMVDERVGAEASFEERQRAARSLAHELLWLEEEMELRALVTTAQEIEVAGKTYLRLSNTSRRGIPDWFKCARVRHPRPRSAPGMSSPGRGMEQF